MTKNPAVQLVENRLDKRAASLLERLFVMALRPADAIICLQGDRPDRLVLTLDLRGAGWAPKIVLTGNNEMMERRLLNDEDDLPLTDLVTFCKEAGVLDEDLIVDDRAMNTRDQAVNVVRLAKEMSWTRLLVVTSPYHLLRSFLTLVKQVEVQKWPGGLTMRSPRLGWTDCPSGRKKTALEMLGEELEKIRRYHQDLVSVEKGEMYENSFSRLP